MGVDRQDQALARMVTDVVVRLRRVPVPDQQAVLVREVLDQFGRPSSGGSTKLYGPSFEGHVVAQVLAVLGEVVVR